MVRVHNFLPMVLLEFCLTPKNGQGVRGSVELTEQGVCLPLVPREQDIGYVLAPLPIALLLTNISHLPSAPKLPSPLY